ncbi:MAG: ATP-binding protein [Desulfovibrio sp.]|jgi:AAA15 family ATPase/GTPase|nr:ATP-binding protein [Desulfovibrio sp.]
MLVSFSVENFLSVKERVELSMLPAEHDKSLPGNIITAQLRRVKPRPVNLLKSAVIYGPNASGKTNILKAVETFSRFVVSAVQNTGKPIPVAPFALEHAWKEKPSSFEISLIEDGTLYRYGFSATASLVHHEYLYATDKAGERKIFERDGAEASVKQSYDYGPTGKNLNKIEQFVRHDSLLLAVGASYNNDDCRVVWRNISMLTVPSFDMDMRKVCLPDSIKTEQGAKILSEISKYLGFGFSKLSIQHQGIGQSGKLECGKESEPEIVFSYTDSRGREVLLDERTQSDGTIIFLNLLAGVLAVSENIDHTFFLDEIEAGLHPLLCEALFRFVHALPSNNIQIVCTTHNTQLLNADLFRRDQVWITEKNEAGATDLYSLADFMGKPRKDARWGKQYLEGRFGGLPVLNTSRVEAILSRGMNTAEAVR